MVIVHAYRLVREQIFEAGKVEFASQVELVGRRVPRVHTKLVQGLNRAS